GRPMRSVNALREHTIGAGRVLAFAAAFTLSATAVAQENPKPAAWWPQFRGPDGLAVAEGKKLPAEFGPKKNVLWKTPLPSGHSSPCVWNDRIFATGFDKAAQKLETICLSRTDGTILWRRPAPAEKIEKFHPAGSPAVSTPVTDGERVYVYFGSYGIL